MHFTPVFTSVIFAHLNPANPSTLPAWQTPVFKNESKVYLFYIHVINPVGTEYLISVSISFILNTGAHL